MFWPSLPDVNSYTTLHVTCATGWQPTQQPLELVYDYLVLPGISVNCAPVLFQRVLVHGDCHQGIKQGQYLYQFMYTYIFFIIS
jgi:hypothetical protein